MVTQSMNSIKRLYNRNIISPLDNKSPSVRLLRDNVRYMMYNVYQ